jgi:hypothetical protein
MLQHNFPFQDFTSKKHFYIIMKAIEVPHSKSLSAVRLPPFCCLHFSTFLLESSPCIQMHPSPNTHIQMLSLLLLAVFEVLVQSTHGPEPPPLITVLDKVIGVAPLSSLRHRIVMLDD